MCNTKSEIKNSYKGSPKEICVELILKYMDHDILPPFFYAEQGILLSKTTFDGRPPLMEGKL